MDSRAVNSLFGADDAEEAVAYEHFARVAVERAIDHPEGLTYAHDGSVRAGQRVRVPLGSSSVEGVVLRVGGPELLDGLDPRRARAITGTLGSPIPADLVELAEWISTYYVTPIGQTLAAMVPAAVKAGVGKRVRTLVRPVADVNTGHNEVLETLTPTARSAWQGVRALDASVFPVDRRELAAMVGASNAGPINRLVDAGLLEEVEVTTVRTPAEFEPPAALTPAPPPTPTPDQRGVIDGIARTLGSFQTHLLMGVTGSGKTEVYLRLIERVLARGESALVLVPEISLTPQTASRFLARFEQVGVAVLHSGLAASARHKQWAAAASGDARVVIGARSAVFAPVQRLGLVIVDEEHDGSYKQDRAPRYHGRDVAIKRAHLTGCPVVLGTATPSVESYANARAQRSVLWKLGERATGAPMPSVRVVDIARERMAVPANPNAYEAIGPTLAKSIERTLGAGGQAILLLNRRGFASVVACPSPSCGWVLECDACDATMVVHRANASRGYVRCHHCLAEQLRPERCPVCEKKTVELGAGTQRVERELERRFGASLGLVEGDTLARVDADTMRHARDYFGLLERFARGDVRVLLGTQMVAKGLDFPNVRLVGVISADTGMMLPDFRAGERTFQLVSQVAGRAGRGEYPGEVVVQTLNPRDPAIVLASRHDAVRFLERELQLRARSGLPPARRMARVVHRDESLEKARSAASATAAHIRGLSELADHGLEVIGPAPCALARLHDRHRIAVTLIAPGPGLVQRALASARAAGLVTSDAHTAVDVDPLHLL